MNEDPRKRVIALVGEVNAAELACRIAEALMNIQRPNGATPQAALRKFDDEVRHGFYRAAARACEYIVEQINAGVRPS